MLFPMRTMGRSSFHSICMLRIVVQIERDPIVLYRRSSSHELDNRLPHMTNKSSGSLVPLPYQLRVPLHIVYLYAALAGHCVSPSPGK